MCIRIYSTVVRMLRTNTQIIKMAVEHPNENSNYDKLGCESGKCFLIQRYNTNLCHDVSFSCIRSQSFDLFKIHRQYRKRFKGKALE